MPTEVVDLLSESVRRLEASVEAMRQQMEREHKALRESVMELEKRVHAIETHQRIVTWLTAPVCLAVGAVIRDVISKWL